MIDGITETVKSIGDKVGSLFEPKEKTTAEVAAEKVDNAKKAAQDQIKKTSEAIVAASSDASKKIGESASDVKSGCDKLATAGKEKLEQGSHAAAESAVKASKAFKENL